MRTCLPPSPTEHQPMRVPTFTIERLRATRTTNYAPFFVGSVVAACADLTS
jgi:hypothetical protein